MKKYKSTRYIEEKALEEGLGGLAAAAAPIAQMVAYPAMMGAAGTAVQYGMQGVSSVGSLIKNVYDKYKFDKHGCDKIIDPNRRNQCEAREIDKIISGLRTQTKYCKSSKDPTECTQRLNQEIQKNIDKKNEMLQTYSAQVTG